MIKVCFHKGNALKTIRWGDDDYDAEVRKTEQDGTMRPP